MFQAIKRAVILVLVTIILIPAVPVHARQSSAGEQWGRVQRLASGTNVLIAYRGSAPAKRRILAVLDDGIVFSAPRRSTERIARADIDRIALPRRGSQLAASVMGWLGFFFGIAAAATSAPNKGAAAAIMIGTPIAFGTAGYHAIKRGEKLIYERDGAAD